ncbi:iron (metal) dependent repressor, DtxR family [Halpernia humi]|uniref:Transcriptional regulator MntR n=1 Tax=Halpernia humi TaxID=493375 RepID=A0A1H5SJR1_9FLAO|nr:metal-dependent transcriptional regulator [Halpernia humi]SEF50826.1 iron (metal) dependent repressor, DtxR family [Halpernia humi]
MKTLTEENYLKAIFHLIKPDNTVTVTDLSKFLNIKMPSVNSMMKKFVEKDWVRYESYKPLEVTEFGKKEAALIVRKHRLTEMFLVKKMNIGWENVHDIAEQLEHIHSDEFFEKMDEMLNFPKIDPHGEPIPDKDGNIITQDLKKLSDSKVGEKIILKAVTLDTEDFLSFLNERNLTLETEMQIIKIEKIDASMTVEFLNRTEIFSKIICDKLLVKA